MQLHSHTDPLHAADLQLSNDTDVLSQNLQGVHTIALDFPHFTDGRAFSQALMLRRRCGFQGEIRATGDVLVDQLQQMQRCGFSSAVLRADQSLDKGRELMSLFGDFYQGDTAQPQPLFAR